MKQLEGNFFFSSEDVAFAQKNTRQSTLREGKGDSNCVECQACLESSGFQAALFLTMALRKVRSFACTPGQ